MTQLSNILTNPQTAASVVSDCCALIDEEVASKSGLSGMALKAGYRTFKGLRPDLLREAVAELLPEFSQALEPLHTEAQQSKVPAETLFSAQSSRAAEALLGITDKRAQNVDAGIIKATYQKLRPMAKKHVEAALPRVGRLVDKYAPTT